MRIINPVLWAISLTGCVLATGPEDTLEDHRRKWDAAAVDRYRFAFHAACFCPEEFGRITIVTVVGGTVQAVVFADTGEPVQGFPLDSSPRKAD